jgi:hypothetical protein
MRQGLAVVEFALCGEGWYQDAYDLLEAGSTFWVLLFCGASSDGGDR